jgi:Spy/CpxP family protein refolding chaperone
MKDTFTRIAITAGLASAMLFAQTPAPSNPAQPPVEHRQWHRGQFCDRMATRLNLTEDQKQQTRSIMQASRESSRPVVQQLRQNRQALRDAIKAGKSNAEIDQLSANVGTLAGQLATIRARSFAKTYALLTPEQRTKADEMAHHARGMFMGGHEHRDGAGAGQ